MCLSSLYSQKCQVHFYRLVQVPPRKFDIWTFWKPKKFNWLLQRTTECWYRNEKKKKSFDHNLVCGPFAILRLLTGAQEHNLVSSELILSSGHTTKKRGGGIKQKISRKTRERAEKEREKESLDRFEDLTGGKKKKKKIDTHPKTRRDHPSKPTQPMGNKTRTRRTKWRRLSLGKLNLFFIWSKSSRKDLISHATAIFFR